MTISHDANSLGAPLTVAQDIPPSKVAIVIGLIALADWLFYRHPVGISVVIFLAALAAASVGANPIHAGRRDIARVIALLVAGFVPMAIQPGLLAAMFAIAGVAYTAVTATEPGMDRTRRLAACRDLVVDTTWRAVADIYRALYLWSESTTPRVRHLIGWIVPLGLGAVFLMLFWRANPLIEDFFSAIDIRALLGEINVARTLFWLLCAALVWPFVFARHRAVGMTAADGPILPLADISLFEFPAARLNDTVILRSLLLFNAIFLIQTVLDLAYLWGGVALPDGITYAAYAHRGAYPLIFTALLAAAFVVVALRPGSDAERSRAIRLLVFAWIAQNVLLVMSSLLRLDLYVAVYSLSYWRVAAAIWMGLVGVGLVLIVARVVLGRSNRWLVATNMAALVLTLYAVSLVNLPAFIAGYNVDHSREFTGNGPLLDLNYLESMGPRAIPALDRYIAQAPDDAKARLLKLRTDLFFAWKQRGYETDWRAWNYLDAKLADYLNKQPDQP
jgi:hypothetical protein